MNAFWSPSGSVDATKSVVGNTSDELSTLFIRLPTAITDSLSKSITGDRFDTVVVNPISKKKDFAPPSSFVSFILDAIILDVSNLKFSFSGITFDVVAVENELS